MKPEYPITAFYTALSLIECICEGNRDKFHLILETSQPQELYYLSACLATLVSTIMADPDEMMLMVQTFRQGLMEMETSGEWDNLDEAE